MPLSNTAHDSTALRLRSKKRQVWIKADAGWKQNFDDEGGELEGTGMGEHFCMLRLEISFPM